MTAVSCSSISRAEKARLRFLRRVERELRAEAVAKLADAKRAHDALESVYNPMVDFDGVYELAHTEAQRLIDRA